MRKTLYVSPSGTQWKVHWQGDSAGDIYQLKETAIREARKKVAALPAGTVSQIRVQRADGTFQDEWTYGKDPYPPVG